MKKLCLGIVVGVCGMLSIYADNVVANGDFLQGQYRWNPETGDQVLQAEFTNEELNLKRRKDGFARVFQDVALRPGKYDFSYNVKMLTPKTQVHVWLILKNNQNKYLEKDYIYLSSFFSDDQLKRVSKTIEIPADIVGARLCITVNGANAEAVIDDVKLELQP